MASLLFCFEDIETIYEFLLKDTQGLHCKYPGELHTIPFKFVIRNCMELSRRLFLITLGAADFCHVWSARGVSPDTLLSGKCHHMKAKKKRSRRRAEAGKNKRLFFFHFRGQFCFDLVKNQVFRL